MRREFYDLEEVPTDELEIEIAIRKLIGRCATDGTPWCAWNGCRGCAACKAHTVLRSKRWGMNELIERMNRF